MPGKSRKAVTSRTVRRDRFARGHKHQSAIPSAAQAEISGKHVHQIALQPGAPNRPRQSLPHNALFFR